MPAYSGLMQWATAAWKVHMQSHRTAATGCGRACHQPTLKACSAASVACAAPSLSSLHLAACVEVLGVQHLLGVRVVDVHLQKGKTAHLPVRTQTGRCQPGKLLALPCKWRGSHTRPWDRAGSTRPLLRVAAVGQEGSPRSLGRNSSALTVTQTCNGVGEGVNGAGVAVGMMGCRGWQCSSRDPFGRLTQAQSRM